MSVVLPFWVWPNVKCLAWMVYPWSYVRFWDILGEDLVCVVNSCYRDGMLSLSQCSGVISLSLKRGDRLDIRNWRPISLLNVDYKLASRVIAGRLLKVIHFVVENVSADLVGSVANSAEVASTSASGTSNVPTADGPALDRTASGPSLTPTVSQPSTAPDDDERLNQLDELQTPEPLCWMVR